MTEVLLFHHAQGQTTGFRAFADDLKAAGHVVHTPDLYDGKTFATLDDGVDYAREIGFEEILRRGEAAAKGMPPVLVYAGFSLGVMPAQKLTQTRPGAKGALFISACLPPSEFETPWPDDVPLQVHMMDQDPWGEEDIPAARDLVAEVKKGELFLYPGTAHLFADSSLSDFNPDAAALLKDRVLKFLAQIG
jgi:dienelactone hydrolase